MRALLQIPESTIISASSHRELQKGKPSRPRTAVKFRIPAVHLVQKEQKSSLSAHPLRTQPRRRPGTVVNPQWTCQRFELIFGMTCRLSWQKVGAIGRRAGATDCQIESDLGMSTCPGVVPRAAIRSFVTVPGTGSQYLSESAAALWRVYALNGQLAHNPLVTRMRANILQACQCTVDDCHVAAVARQHTTPSLSLS